MKSKLSFKTLKQIYTLKFIVLNIGLFILYYFIFDFFIKIQNNGALLLNVPVYILYLLFATASIMMTISIALIIKSVKKTISYVGSGFGIFSSIFSGVIAGCGCSFPLLFSIIALLGLNSSYAILLDNIFSNYASLIFFVLSLVNILMIFYLLIQFNSSNICKIKKSKKQRNNKIL